MKRILFVDGDPDSLATLKRSLADAPEEWDAAFVQDEGAALTELAKAPVDVLISELTLPLLTGDEFLRVVREKFPQTVRVILTAQSDRDSILRLAGAAHQYLSKPCEDKLLCDTIERALALRDLVGNENLKRVVAQIQSLPSIPSLYMQMLRELREPEPSIVKLGHLISQDMGMCTKMLQLVNSAFFGLPQQLSNPVEAIIYLGVEMVKNIIVSLQLFSMFDGVTVRNFSFERLWAHSWLTGVLAKRIAQSEELGAQADYAFIGGLVHDVGKLVLATGMPTQYQAIIDFHHLHRKPLGQVEQEFLGATHAEVGAYLLGLWGLPAPIVEAVAFHHRPSAAPHQDFNLGTVLHVANALEHERHSESLVVPPATVDLEYITQLGLLDRLDFWREAVAPGAVKEAV